MSFAPDPDTGDLEASIGAWVDVPHQVVPQRDHMTATRDNSIAHGGSWSLRHTQEETDTAPGYRDGGYVGTTPLPAVATGPALGSAGRITVTGWVYIPSTSGLDLRAHMVLIVYDAADALIGIGISGGVLTLDAWVQDTCVVGSFDAAAADHFSLNVVMSTDSGAVIPPGTYLNWDDFDYTGELTVTPTLTGWVVG